MPPIPLNPYRPPLILPTLITLLILPNPAPAQVTWLPPDNLNSNASHDFLPNETPHTATDGDGTWITVWSSPDDIANTGFFDSDILFSRSTNNGATWSPAALITPTQAMDGAQADTAPRIATGAGVWLAVWVNQSNLGKTGADTDLLVTRSTDGGQTWSSPTPLNADHINDSTDDTQPRLATNGAGAWITVWRKERGLLTTDHDIMFARSTDGGLTWSTPTPIAPNADTDLGADETPDIAYGAGAWIATWHSNEPLNRAIGTDFDIFSVRSTDNGLTWSDINPINSNALDLTGDDRNPAITADGKGTWITVWESSHNLLGLTQTEGDILYARSTDNGLTWENARPLNTNAINDRGLDTSPAISSDKKDSWIAIWSSQDSLNNQIGTDPDILITQATGGANHWSAPQPLTTRAKIDNDEDTSPTLATDGKGHWLSVWARAYQTGPNNSTTDIAVARSSDTGALTGIILGALQRQNCAAIRALNITTRQEFTTATGPAGRYFIQLPAGRYRLTAFAAGLQPESILTLIEAAQKTTAHFLLEINPLQTGIRGRVIDADTANPIVAARVVARAGATILAETLTCANGLYELRFSLPPKDGPGVTVDYEAEGYSQQQSETNVSQGQVTESGDTPLMKGAFAGAIAGTIHNLDTAAPIENATITIHGPIHISTTADTSGAFSFTAIPEGGYTAEANAENYTPQLQPLSVESLTISTVTFNLQPANETPQLSISPKDILIPPSETTFNLIILNEGGGPMTWSATITQGAEWLSTAKTTEGINDGALPLSAQRNPTSAPRQSHVKVTSPEAGLAETTFTQPRREDINFDGASNAVDVQLTINAALDISGEFDTDIDANGLTNAVDVQLAILAALE